MKQASQLPPAPILPSKRHASWLFLRRPKNLTAEEQGTVMRLRQLATEVDQAYLLVPQFVEMLRT
jgi:hypothetical protein